MSDSWVSHVWIGEDVLIWGEREGVPFEKRLTGLDADAFSMAEAKADGIIRRASFVAAGISLDAARTQESF